MIAGRDFVLPDYRASSMDWFFFIQFLILLVAGDSQWSDWSEWTNNTIVSDENSWIMSNLTVATCKRTNQTRTRRCNSIAHGEGSFMCAGNQLTFDRLSRKHDAMCKQWCTRKCPIFNHTC